MRIMMIGLTFILILVAAMAFANISGPLDEQHIIERIKSEGEVTVLGGPPKQAEKPVAVADIGKNRYEQTCKLCHESGLAGAPKFGDKADWAPRISQGTETLYNYAIHGLKAMPPKGGCSTCSDDEIKKTVDYMVSHSK